MGSTFKIEPFKHPIAMDPNYADKTWRILESAIREIHNQNASGLSFEELYRNAYNMVLHKFGDRLYSGVQEALRSHLRGVAGDVVNAQGTPFLQELVSRWNDHNKSTQMIRDILMYMDRTYVMQQHKVPVFQLGLDLWRDQVIRQQQIHQRLSNILSDMVARERGGEIVDKALLRSITQMLMDLGKPTYEADFEQAFLSDAAEFYKKEAAEFLSQNNAPDYMRKAERRLQEEVERVRAYLDESTEPKITKVAEHELIAKQMEQLATMEGSGLIPLLVDSKYEDLGRMYSLFRRVEGGLDLLRKMMGAHITSQGMALVQDPEKTGNAVEFVKLLLDMRDKYETTITQAFSDDKNFKNTLNSSFEEFVNKQPRSPEFVSLYIDELLRNKKQEISDADVEARMDKVMPLFRYLREKDHFERQYKKHLSKRLLANKAPNEDWERNMLLKLKTECGYQFTSKLESMFNDIKISRDMMGDFKEYLQAGRIQMPVDMSVQVLTIGSWPTQSAQVCNLPRELQQGCDIFQTYYGEKHGGRNLTWQTNMGTVDLKGMFDKRYEFSTSTYQAMVLLLFNDRAQWSFKEIQQQTEIPAPELKRALQGMMQGKTAKDSKAPARNVLTKEPKGRDVGEEDVFTLNEGFRNKGIRVKLSAVSSQKEGEAEHIETRQKIDEDRKPQIDAAIVRIMKARKQLDHNSVVVEVTQQLRSRFLASAPDIKKRIENLIEREFLERDPNDRKMYRYLA